MKFEFMEKDNNFKTLFSLEGRYLVKNVYRILIITISIFLFGNLSPTLAEDSLVIIGLRDHFEITCRNDLLLDFNHVIILTANNTWNGNVVSEYSFTGKLASEIRNITNSDIENLTISGDKGSSNFKIIYDVSLKPHKFTKVELEYTWDGLLKKDDNGYFIFEASFNSKKGFVPEIFLKIPKPSQFHKLELKKCLPPPQVFMEETSYYVLSWATKSFDFEDVTTTHIDLKYRTKGDFSKMIEWTFLVVLGVFIGWGVKGIIRPYFSRFLEKVRRARDRFYKKKRLTSKC